ncbi:hypothetical protein ScPMuIL_009288 [Solemya velum]
MCLHTVSRVCLVCILVSSLSRGYGFNELTGEPPPHDNKNSSKHASSHDPHDNKNGSKHTSSHDPLEATGQAQFYIKKLFTHYGDGNVLTFEGFEHLMENLGLGGIEIKGHKVVEHQVNESFREMHPDHEHSISVPVYDRLHMHRNQSASNHSEHEHRRRRRASKRKRSAGDIIEDGDHDHDTDMGHEDGDHDNHTDHDHHTDGDHAHANEEEKCFSPAEMLHRFHLDDVKAVNGDQFSMLCPALIFQLDGKFCSKQDHSTHDHESSKGWDLQSIPLEVWGYSTISVIIISMVGLLGVAIIPVMQKVFYNHLLQFLVALAVGALSGDALLHLLPHSFQGESRGHGSHDSHEGASHSDGVHKGLCGLLGIFFFFFIERVLTIITHNKRSKKKLKKKSSRNSDGAVAGARLSSRKTDDCQDSIMVVHPNKALKNLADDSHDQYHVEMTALTNHNHCEDEDDSVLHSHHGHSHLHGNKLPTSVASIAWMVILGDGIHNFSDGLAIGAAFANSITGGISTSVAVFCHELPHEIGDFAVLLRAGMPAKQAMVYNCVSSILCLIGMFIGVTLGNISSASLWIFACVGGLFLYIALVDMLPEMTSVDTKQGENPFCHLIFQCLGMAVGGGIMLVIAIFEDSLKSALEP